MSTWQQYLEEKKKIEELVVAGYFIAKIIEVLDGDVVLFTRVLESEETDIRELRLFTADARKYVGVVLIEQIKSVPA